MTDDPTTLTRAVLERYRMTLVKGGEPLVLCLPEEVADFIFAEVVANHPPGEYLGAVFVDDDLHPLATAVPYLGYFGRLTIEPQRFLVPAGMIRAGGFHLFRHRPGADPLLTRRDVRVAKRVLKTAPGLGLSLIDYFVLGNGDWTSLDAAGRLRFPPFGTAPRPDGRARVKPKYRNPERPSQTWSGRGRRALWLQEKIRAGAQLEDFAVEE